MLGLAGLLCLVHPIITATMFAKDKTKSEKIGHSLAGFGMSSIAITLGLILGSMVNPEAYETSTETQNSYESSTSTITQTPEPTPEPTPELTPEPEPPVLEAVEEEPPEPENEPQVQTVVSLEGQITRYFLDDSPEVMVSLAIYDKNTGKLEFYNQIQSGGYAGYRYYFRCEPGGSIYTKDKLATNDQWQNMGDTFRCDVSKGPDGIPTNLTVVDAHPSDPFTLMRASFTPSTRDATSDFSPSGGSPVEPIPPTMPSRPVGVPPSQQIPFTRP